ncbi:MAG TPA: hypothetical protein VEJ63_20165, partial [Planctomycetota bacterium]|nr:hypothetical protein [Planctomycetota bacterium]
MIELLFLGAIAAAALVALVLTPLVRALSLKSGFVDQPGERKIHTQPIAYGGGIAVALSMAAAAALLLYLRKLYYPGASTREDAGVMKLAIIAGGAAGALLLGLI